MDELNEFVIANLTKLIKKQQQILTKLKQRLDEVTKVTDKAKTILSNSTSSGEKNED